MTANHKTGEQAIAVLRKEFCTYILPSDSTHCPTFPFCWGGVLDTQRDRSSDIYNLMEISRMLVVCSMAQIKTDTDVQGWQHP